MSVDSALQQVKEAYEAEVSVYLSRIAALEQESVSMSEKNEQAQAVIEQLRLRVTELENILAEIPQDQPWTPSRLSITEPRPSGADFVRIEDLGVGNDLRRAAKHSGVHNKILTLPAGVFELVDYAQGDNQKFMHGLMINPSSGSPLLRGIFGSGHDTVIRMKADSSRFRSNESATQNNQVLLSTLMFYNIDNVVLANFTLQGTNQPHFFHGIRVNGDDANIHHIKFSGASKGDFNSPPGETNSLAISGADNSVFDCEFDCSLNGTPFGSSAIGYNGGTDNSFKRIWVHDQKSGFGIAMWQSVNLFTEDFWIDRPGTGAGGYNGAAFNHEESYGTIRHIRPHINLDGYWGPTDGKPRRNQGKFGHFTLWNSTTANAYDVTVEEPVFDSWGGIKGGFAVVEDTQQTKVKIIKNGRTLQRVVRPEWWMDRPAPFDPATQYWSTNVSGSGSVWG